MSGVFHQVQAAIELRAGLPGEYASLSERRGNIGQADSTPVLSPRSADADALGDCGEIQNIKLHEQSR